MPLRHYIQISLIIITLFMGAGSFHIAQFETSDEHFWRDTRITQYYNAITERKFEQTAINDKPGVSLALITAPAWIFLDDNTTIDKKNLSLRASLLLWHAFIILPLLSYMLWRIFTPRTAMLTFSLIALAPTLIGMSRIINPDAILWSATSLVIIGWIYICRNPQSYIWIGTIGIFWGIALLSKYTANLLLLFLPLYALMYITSKKTCIAATHTDTKDIIKAFLLSLCIALLLFTIFLPAAFITPGLFLKSTFLSPPIAPIIIPLGLIMSIFFCDIFFLNAYFTKIFANFIQKYSTWILRLCAIPLLTLIIIAIVNAWSTPQWIPLENLKEIVDAKKHLSFPMFAQAALPLALIGKIATESLSTFFAIHTLTLVLFVSTLVAIIIRPKIFSKHFALYTTILVTPWIFFIGGLMADVFVTVRYGILLQPLIAIGTAIGIATFLEKSPYKIFVIAIGLIISIHAFTLTRSAPYLLIYHNIFLPQKFIVTDAWGHGSYEAAQWLNQLPNAQSITVWSDRKGVCRHFIGRCTLRNKIQPDEMPDYFVFSRRNIARKKYFGYVKPKEMPFAPEMYYQDFILEKPIWKHVIHNRPQNYTLIIKRTEAEKTLMK